MSLVRTDYGPATADDLPGLGRIMAEVLAPKTPAFFATQESTPEQRLDWWTRILRRFYVASTDARQHELRGACPTYLYRAKAYYDDGTSRVTGMMVCGIVPRDQDRAAHAQLKHADSFLPDAGAPPPGFNRDAFQDCLAGTARWTAEQFPTHSVLIVFLFAVGKGTQGTGVGANLLAEAKELAARTAPQPGDTPSGITQPGRPGVPLALHAVLPAIGFYKKQGLHEESHFDLGRCNQKNMGMYWQAEAQS